MTMKNFIFATGDVDFLKPEHSKRRFFVLLHSTAISPVAFDAGSPGWKKDADGKLVLDGDGNPIFVNAANVEQSVKGDTIATLQSEAKGHRTRAEKAEGDLAKFKTPDGKLLDPEIAVKAVETVGKIDAKKLIDAGEVDKLTDQIKAGFTQQITEKDNALTEARNTINGMKIDGVFKGSEFIAERVAMPRDFFEAAMRSNFKVEDDGKIGAYDRSGNRLMSKKNAGEFADPSEALELLVDMHPQKDTILKANSAGGSGNNGGGGSRGAGRTMKRSDFEALAPADQAAIATKGETAIVD
jgi:hypothetical protein